MFPESENYMIKELLASMAVSAVTASAVKDAAPRGFASADITPTVAVVARGLVVAGE